MVGRRPPAKSRKRWPEPLGCACEAPPDGPEPVPFGFANSHLGGQFDDAGYGPGAQDAYGWLGCRSGA